MELHPDVVLPSRYVYPASSKLITSFLCGATRLRDRADIVNTSVHVAAKERSSAAEIQVLGMDVRTAKTREQSRGNVNF